MVFIKSQFAIKFALLQSISIHLVWGTTRDIYNRFVTLQRFAKGNVEVAYTVTGYTSLETTFIKTTKCVMIYSEIT